MLKVKLIIIIHTIHVFIHIKEKNTGEKKGMIGNSLLISVYLSLIPFNSLFWILDSIRETEFRLTS